jgi:hypothetical protein
MVLPGKGWTLPSASNLLGTPSGQPGRGGLVVLGDEAEGPEGVGVFSRRGKCPG